MRKPFYQLLVAFSLVMMLGSCALHQGVTTNATVTVLEKANFTYVHRQVEGKSSVQYIVGFGGLRRQALVDEAKRDLMRRMPLSDNQALANMTVHFKTSCYVLYEVIACTVVADIIEFN